MRGISIKRKTLDEIRTTLTANFTIELSYLRREKDYRKDSLIFFEYIPNAVFCILSDFIQNTIKVSRKP